MVRIEPLENLALANLKFSRNSEKHGPPPRRVRVGSILMITFDDPTQLITTGVFCDPKVRKLLVDNVPGFKKISNRDRSKV